jgi:hypothetical protein
MKKLDDPEEECIPYSEDENQEFLRILEICNDGS